MPKPVLQAMVLAEHVYRDVSGKHIICGTFTHQYFVKNEDPGRLPKREWAGTPFLYLALVEVHGRVPLELKFVDLSDSSIMFEAKFFVTSNDPIAISEYSTPMPPQIQPSKVGNYSLDLLHENEILGSWRISVREFDDQSKEARSEQ